MKASVIIPTFNRSGQLSRTLASLVALDYRLDLFEIIVVDNGSVDDTKQIVDSCIVKFPEHKIRYFFDNVPGLLTGRHRGAKEAKGELLIFIDDDISVEKKWLKSIVETFENYPDVHLVGGKCLPAYEKTPPEWLDAFWKELPDGGKMLTDLSLCDYGDKEKEVDQTWIWGLNYSIRKSSFLKFGGFHPDNISPRYQHFQGDGETGLSLKLKENGAKAWYNPQVIVYHEVPAERMTYFYFEKRYFYQGVCNSFTGIRRIKGSRIRKIIATFVEMSKALARKILRTNAFKLTKNNNVSIEVQLLFARLSEMEKAGYRFHQKIAWSNPQVMEWVLKENYFDYKLPED